MSKAKKFANLLTKYQPTPRLPGFQKKTQKAPQGEIDKAKRIMNEYFESKNKKGE